MDIVQEIKKNKFPETKTENGCSQYLDIKNVYKGKYILVGKYLHSVYAPMSKEDSQAFLDELRINVNHKFLSFLSKYNGLILFSGSLVIYGFGRIKINGIYQTCRNPALPLPFHLYDENNGKVFLEHLKIGSICENGLYLDNSSGNITRIDKNGCKVEQWNDIDSCVEDLYKRISKWYDKDGICKKPIIINNLIFNKLENI